MVHEVETLCDGVSVSDSVAESIGVRLNVRLLDDDDVSDALGSILPLPENDSVVVSVLVLLSVIVGSSLAESVHVCVEVGVAVSNETDRPCDIDSVLVTVADDKSRVRDAVMESLSVTDCEPLCDFERTFV